MNAYRSIGRFWPTTSLLFASLITAVCPPSSAQTPPERPDVLAFYYPWYDAGDWNRHTYDGTPTLGEYGTESKEVAARHIQWAADHGIDGLFVSWWGPDSLTDVHLQQGLLQAENLDRVRFAIFYEAMGRLDAADGNEDSVIDFTVPAVFDRLVADVGYLRGRYFDHPQYWRVGERPLLGIYLTRIFRGFTPEHVERLEEAVDMDLFLLGDEIFFGPQKDPAEARHHGPLFDAYTAYNIYNRTRVRDGESALDYQRREAWPIFRRWADDVDSHFVPCVIPRYHDFRGLPTLTGTPQEFSEVMREVQEISSGQRGEGPNMLLITSFNEWWEGTTVEPAQEYGLDYLEAIRSFSGEERRQSVP